MTNLEQSEGKSARVWDADNHDGLAHVHELLLGYFSTEFGGTAACTIEGLSRTSSGLSRENWMFDLIVDGSRRYELVLRRDPVAALLYTDRSTEFNVLKCLEQTTVPAPVVLWSDLDGKQFGRPALLMRRERGVCDYKILNSQRPLTERRRLAEQLCDLLATVHNVDLEATGVSRVLGNPGAKAATAALEDWTATLHSHVRNSYPELEAAALWLADRAPVSPPPVLVHGDFKPGNVLVDGNAIIALLDWETAHIGDLHEDLGWVTQPVRASEHQIAGEWELDHLIHRYADTTGRDVDRAALAWWQVFSSFKSGIIQLTGLQAYLDGRSDRLFREPAPYLRRLLQAMMGDRNQQ